MVFTEITSKSGFALTPHKVAMCHLIKIFVHPAETAVPMPFVSIADQNRLGLLLFSLTRYCDDFVELPLLGLINQLKGINDKGDFLTKWESQTMIDRLRVHTSPDHLYIFFNSLKAVLAPVIGMHYDDRDDRIFLDPTSQLGVFLRSCILAFNTMTFENICHLLTNIRTYCSITTEYDLADEEYNESRLRDFLENEDPDPDFADSDKYIHEFEAGTSASDSSFYIQAPKPLYGFVEGDQKSKISQDSHLDSAVYPFNNDFKDADQHGLFLRSKWQILGYLNEQADLIEKHSGSFHLSSFDAILNQLQKMAPELHRVRYLQYLKSLYHEDYLPAVDNLHCYFDCSAGMDGLFIGSPTLYTPSLNLGKYESALLCLGTMHCHFGHSKQALEALTEAVRISHLNNDDSCLAYTLTTICNLMSEIGISSSIGVIGSPYTLGTDAGMGMPLTIQQHLLVLLKKSQKRAEELKLTCLVGFNRLALAKFELKNVKRPLLSFGPKAPTTLRTSPVSVCKELRLSSYLFSEFETDRMSFQPDNGTFSTSWLKNLPEFRDSSVCAHALGRNDFDAFNFGAQPNPIPGSVLQLAGASHLLRATSWELLGSAPLARISTLTYLCCFADASSSEDLSLSYAKLIQHLAVFNGHKEAFNVLKSAEERFLPVSKSRIQLQLVHEHALHRGRLKYSQEVCDEFSVLCSSIAGVDLEHKTEASLRHARTLLAANQFNQAADVAHSLFCTCYKYNLHVENASVLLLLAEIHKKSRNAVLGLPYALASLSFCHSFNLDLLEASATLTVAELWLAIGSSHAKRALSLVNRKFAIILGHGGLELCARANIVVTKCYLFDPSFSVCEDPDIVLTSLTQATEDLEILEYHEMAAEAFYLLAMVYDMLGQVEEREEAAFSFKRHIVALEKPEDDNDLYQFLQ